MSADIGLQGVDMIDLLPELGVGEQDIANLRAFQIERQPARLIWNVVVVESGPVKPAQFLPLARQQGRYPVQNDADAVLVAAIDKGHQVGGPAVARVGREIAGNRLAAPPQRQFDVIKSPFEQMRQHDFRQLAVTGDPIRTAAGLFGECDAVNGRRQPPGRLDRARHPRSIVPFVMAVKIADKGGVMGIFLSLERHRIGFWKNRAFGVADFEFVKLAQFDFGNEQFPHARAVPFQGMTPAVPLVEGADHADPAGVRSPKGEVDAPDSVFDSGMRAQLGGQAVERALLERPAVRFGEEQRIAGGVGIVKGVGVAVAVDRHQPIIQVLDARKARDEHAVRVRALHLALVALRRQYVSLFGLR